MTISEGTQGWYGLGPVSVLPEYQRKGIGKALIEEDLMRLKDLKARGCCLVGHPEYYTQFGFEKFQDLCMREFPPEVFFALSFDGHIPQGRVNFHEAFRAQGPQTPAGHSRVEVRRPVTLYNSTTWKPYLPWDTGCVRRCQAPTGRNPYSQGQRPWINKANKNIEP